MGFVPRGKTLTLSAAVIWGCLCASVASAQQSPIESVAPLEKRVPWTTSRLIGSPQPPLPYSIERAFPDLAFETPVELVAIPGTNRLLVLEVKGKVYSFENRADVNNADRDLFADAATLHPQFNLLYGFAFHPRFEENRYCYVSYVLQPKTENGSRVSRFKVTDTDPPRLDLASEQVVITWMAGGHNGAHLQFGPDGCLYISTGDGGESFPPDGRNTGQDVSDLLAAILRIDVDHADGERPYHVPADNPFVALDGARSEIWAYGFRNPWKMCFDPADGSLWVGDVGWEMWEMIYCVERGGNYGWSLVEARQPVHQERQRGPTPILPPTVEHSHIEARSITGGYFSTSSRLPELRGAYIYGDYVTGKIWGLKHAAGKIIWREELVDTPLQMASFGLDHSGDVLIVDHPSGTLHRLVPNPRREANASFPTKLSETGLFASTTEHIPAAGVIPYSINAEPWADGTTAERFVALPGESKLGIFQKTDVQIGYIAGDWEFPSGGVLAKTVSIELEPGNAASRKRLETQILHYDVDTWRAYNYLWNDEQTDAILADDAPSDRALAIRDPASPNGLRRQTWHHASRTECILCHTTRAGSIHGFRPQQLQTIDYTDLLAEPVAKDVVAWSSPYDASASLESRARAWLHVNCAHCHRRGGGGSAPFDIQFATPLAKANLLGVRPTQGTFGIHDARIVAPGDPLRSVLYYRIMKLGHGRMPQFGSQVVDVVGTRLIHDWIASLPPDESETPAENRQATEELALVEKIVTAGSGDAGVLEALDRLLAAPTGALRLLTSIDANRLPAEARERAIERGVAQENPVVRDLFERFVPEEERVKRLGTAVNADEILALSGDASRGRAVFWEAAGVQCRNCHRIGEQGKPLGPDLTQIGKKLDRAKLLVSILEPSQEIDPKFLTYLVETADGQVLSGLLAERTDATVALKLADGKEVRLPAADVERLAPSQKSLMPDLLVREMTAQQLADLLEYLSSLK